MPLPPAVGKKVRGSKVCSSNTSSLLRGHILMCCRERELLHRVRSAHLFEFMLFLSEAIPKSHILSAALSQVWGPLSRLHDVTKCEACQVQGTCIICCRMTDCVGTWRTRSAQTWQGVSFQGFSNDHFPNKQVNPTFCVQPSGEKRNDTTEQRHVG